MEVVVAIAVVLAVASIVAVAVARRRQTGDQRQELSSTPPHEPITSPQPTAPMRAERPDAPPAPEPPTAALALLPLPGDGSTFLALGDVSQLPATLIEPTSLIARPAITKAAQDLAVSVNLPLQFANGLQQGSNLVRLAPETMQALHNGAKFVESGGKVTGVLRGADGRIVELARFTSVSSAVSVAASLGNALALAAIQMQLTQISQQLHALSGQVERISEADAHERLAQVESLSMSVQHALGQCAAAGCVPDRVMNSIAGQAQELDAHIRRLEKDIRAHLARVPGTRSRGSGRAADQMQWLAHDGLPGVNDLNQILVAIQGWLIHQGLYAANLGESGRPDELAAQGQVIEQTTRRHRELEHLVRGLAYEIDRALYVAETAPGTIPKTEWTLRLIDKRSTSTSERVHETAVQLRTTLASAGIPLREVPALPDAESVGVDSDPETTPWRDMLRYRLRDGEQPLLYVHGTGVGGHNNANRAPSVMVFTNERVLGIRKKPFTKNGVFDVDTERTIVTSVRISKIGVGFIPVPGRALRVEFDGGTADIELTGTDDDERTTIESRARAVLDSTSPATPGDDYTRPLQIEGLPLL